MSDEPDDTDMTPEGFRAALLKGIPVDLAISPEKVLELREWFDNTDQSESIENATLEDDDG